MDIRSFLLMVNSTGQLNSEYPLQKGSNNMLTMTKDNNFGSTATKPQYAKRTVQIERDVLTMEIRRYYKWRKGDMIKRLYKEGSVSFDNFINNLIERGY